MKGESHLTKLPVIATVELGINVWAAETSWKSGPSIEVSRFDPMITVAYPSPKRAWPTKESKASLDGPQNVTTVISEHTTRTRAPALFSTKSFAVRRTVPPA